MADLIISLIIFMILSLVIFSMLRSRKRAKASGCGTSCAGCSENSCSTCSPDDLKNELKKVLHSQDA